MKKFFKWALIASAIGLVVTKLSEQNATQPKTK